MERKIDYQQVERAIILVFFLISMAAFAFNPSSGTNRVEPVLASNEIQAYAAAMPNQGWAPLVVHFSAFGSRSTVGTIVRYEWDLDGNGRYDTDATSENGYTSYIYKKSGTYTITLKVTDDQGNVATDSIAVTVRYPGSSSVDYWTIFDNSTVGRVDIQVTSADWAAIWEDPEAKLTIPANVSLFGEQLDNVGLRMRGQFSLRESGDKKPWEIDTDYFVDGQEFHNLRQLMFLNNIGDPSMLQEKLAYDMMQFAGVPASFTRYVEIWIDISDDDQPALFWGVYTMVERVDRKFLANRFGRDNASGNLYKASHASRGPMDLIYYGPEITDYPTQNGLYAYGKMTNEEEGDYADIIYLMYVIDGVEYESPEEFAAALEQVFNVDSFLRYTAVVNLLGNWDIYQYTGNNYYLYNNPGTGLFEWIPWDLNWGSNPHHPVFGGQGPGLVARAPLYERVFAVEEYRVRYAAYLDLLVRVWFTEENISARASYYYELIAPLVRQGDGDRMYFGDAPNFPVEEFDNSWLRLVDFTRQRRDYVLSILAGDAWRSPGFIDSENVIP
ncbi:MAG: CotH kinase family protein [Anaerolineales bacterium]|nr:CotH kinase family protein [Anaerolineales bacterium]